jgi:hypothetical protein
MTIAPRVERAEPASQSKRAGRASGCDHEFHPRLKAPRVFLANRRPEQTPDLVRSNRACRFFSFG